MNMTRRRPPKKNPRRKSTEDERILSSIVPLVRTHKKMLQYITSQPIWKRMHRYFWVSLTFRLISVFMTNTEFVPDEAWQSTEVAYYYTWGGGRGQGQGHGHLTWEWIVGLRSHLVPSLLRLLYGGLRLCGWDSPYSLIMWPRVFQAMLSALGEYALFLYATARFGKSCGMWTLFSTTWNWFLFYTGSRTISNTTEMALNSIALFLFQREEMVSWVGVVALNFLIRPTAVVIWIPYIWDILKLFFPLKVPHRLPGAVFVGLLVLVGGALLDSWFLGQPVLSWLRFFRFNVLEGGSSQFGRHHVLWYFYSAIPSIFGFGLIPLIGSLSLRILQKEWIRVLAFFFVFSLLPHKEIRFLLPILPLMFVLMGDILHKFWDLEDLPEMKEVKKEERVDSRGIMKHWIVAYVVSNLVAAFYFSGFHQGGIFPCTQFINQKSAHLPNPQIWVVTQCYAVPVYTYMHNPSASFEMVTCAPRGLERMGLDYSAATLPNYDVYTNFTSPFNPNATAAEGARASATADAALLAWTREKLGMNSRPPDFILCFQSMMERVIRVLEVGTEGAASFEKCFSYPHAQFGEDRGTAVVLCRKGLFPPPPDPLDVDDI